MSCYAELLSKYFTRVEFSFGAESMFKLFNIYYTRVKSRYGKLALLSKIASILRIWTWKALIS